MGLFRQNPSCDAEPDGTKAKANEDVVIYILYYRRLVGKMNWYVVLKSSPFPYKSLAGQMAGNDYSSSLPCNFQGGRHILHEQSDLFCSLKGLCDESFTLDHKNEGDIPSENCEAAYVSDHRLWIRFFI